LARHLIAVGARFRVEALMLPNGTCEVCDFLEAQSVQDQAKLCVLFERLAEAGRISNVEKFKKVRGDIWAFKSYQIRVFCFFTSDRCVILVYGLKKKTDRYSPKEIERAERLRQVWLSSRER
jgi:hypothetical protein